MAISAVVDIARLDEGWILAPERYDPRRRRAKDIGPCLGDFVHVRRDHVNAKAEDARRFLVFDTGDAQHGIISVNKSPCAGTDIRSMKKRIYPHQVIISRLRPYLRQVAWVDPGLLAEQEPDVDLLCSTEFFVLESVVDNASIAFLAPFLLSAPVQTILAAAQGRWPPSSIQRAHPDDITDSGVAGRERRRTLSSFRARRGASPRSIPSITRERRDGHAPPHAAAHRVTVWHSRSGTTIKCPAGR